MGNSKSKGCMGKRTAPSQTNNGSNTSKGNTNLADMAPNNNCIRVREIPAEFLNLVPDELMNGDDDNKEENEDGDDTKQKEDETI
eukprot:CAMPEP_0201589416 /NCGR_PEP_ID=MMETSP0190_2-20130828/166244_1 /ASSEMBLY_ACC=CAM_ASM_000263 /TAXON_ID=37353 /ORGANISM="Rosalina sp." /LENGTH=84 /DNA_ID=CAMNT_0048043493 /DNA_START=36 /DNA_END=290 /DNA_ORIENTATION=+